MSQQHISNFQKLCNVSFVEYVFRRHVLYRSHSPYLWLYQPKSKLGWVYIEDGGAYIPWNNFVHRLSQVGEWNQTNDHTFKWTPLNLFLARTCAHSYTFYPPTSSRFLWTANSGRPSRPALLLPSLLLSLLISLIGGPRPDLVWGWPSIRTRRNQICACWLPGLITRTPSPEDKWLK